jgi:hypothetical protein
MTVSDPVQFPPSVASVAPVAPARQQPAVEPAAKTQTDNQGASGGDGRPAGSDRLLTITRDPNLHGFVYRSIDAASGEVVWQYPNEGAVRRAEYMRALEAKMREAAGHAVDEQA